MSPGRHMIRHSENMDCSSFILTRCHTLNLNLASAPQNARACRLRCRGYQCSSRSHSLQAGWSFLHSRRSAHRMAVSSSMILGGRDAEIDLTCILHPRHHRPHPEVMVKTGCLLSEALTARRNPLSDQQDPALLHVSTYRV